MGVVNLVPPKQLAATQVSQYTTNGVKAVIDKCTVTNTSALNASFSVNIIRSGVSVSNANLIIDNKTVYPGDTYRCPELIGHVLENKYSLSTMFLSCWRRIS